MTPLPIVQPSPPPEPAPLAPSRPARRAVERVRRSARLASFFARLAIKEHIAPRLHVRPLVAELFLTDNCNLRCVSCACWRSHTTNELSTAAWRSIIDQLADLRFLKLNFTGGEPLIRRDAIGLMAHASVRGIPALHLNTNALLLDERRRTAVIGAGVRSFNVSVDGPTPAIHDAVRGRDGAFATTVRHLEALLALREQHGLKVRMNFTVLRANVAQLPRIAELAQDLRVQLALNLGTDRTFLFRDRQVSEQVDVPRDELRRALSQLERMMRADHRYLPRFSELSYIPRHFSDVVQRDLPCAESQLKLMIHSTGGVGGCWGHDPTMNVRDHGVADVIDSPAYRREHTRLFRKDCVGCGSNYALNLRWRPSSYIQDGLFAAGRRQLAP